MLLIIITIVLISAVTLLAIKLREYVQQVSELKQQLLEKDAAHIIEKAKVKKDSKFRSSAVNWGKSIEHFVPFMSKFPIPPEDVVFVGMPIDYVGFTDTESAKKCQVHFVEVKSGASFMSTKQKNIKKAIEEGRVVFHEIAVESNKPED